MLGHKQALVLEIIVRHGESAYGAGIARQLDEIGEPTALPQIYSVLEKLEAMGLVSSKMSDPTPERGGRRKRVYFVNAGAQKALREFQRGGPASEVRVSFA